MKIAYFPISLYGWTFWMPMAVAGVLLIAVGCVIGAWWLVAIAAVLTFATMAFFRDLPRAVPTEAGIMVAPADGKVTEITRMDHYEKFGGKPALKIGIFLSVLDVHVNRSPCAAVVIGREYAEGLFLDARHPESGAKNQSATLILGSGEAEDHHPIAVVRQVVGAIARRIITPVEIGEKLARGERYGMIAFGSRTELIVPEPERWETKVHLGQHVKGGVTVMLRKA